VVMDRETGQSRGFGFVTFTTAAAAAAAVKALDQQPFNVRPTTAAASEANTNRKPQKLSKLPGRQRVCIDSSRPASMQRPITYQHSTYV
jgi:RNA recognition motif-containing protein